MTKIIVRGPALSQSGYGEHCRSVLRSLKETGHDIYLYNVNWGETGWIFEDNEERRWLDSLIIKTAENQNQEYDLSIQVQLPTEWNHIAHKNIGVTAGLETTEAPNEWISACENMDAVIVPSEHSKVSLANRDNIYVVGYPFFKSVGKKQLPLNVSTDKNFLSVAQWSPRKNIEQTITAFVQEFMLEDVGLILKLHIKNGSNIDRHYTLDRIRTFMGAAPKTMKCRVHLLHGHLTQDEMASLYNSDKVIGYVSSSHGEGYGLPPFEAACSGLPLILPNWGGVVDFTSDASGPLVSEVDYIISELEEYHLMQGVLEAGAKWCYPDTVSLREKMRDVYVNYEAHKKNSVKLKKHLSKKFDNKVITSGYNKIIEEVIKKEK